MSQVYDLRQLQMDISKNKPTPIYFVFGEDVFLVDEAVKLLKEKVLSEGGAIDFNFDQLYASEVKPTQVKDMVETLPMMCSQRVVILKQAHLYKDKDWQTLMPIIEDPVQTCVLIMVAEKADKRKKYFKSLEKSAQLVELKKPYENQIIPWIQYIANKSQIELTHNQCLIFQQLVGSNLSEISSELQKLKQFLGDRIKPTEDEILSIVSRLKTESVFDFTDALGKKDRLLALKILHNLMEHEQNEVGILMLMARHFRIVSKVKNELSKKTPPQKMMEKIGVPQFILKKYMDQADRWSEDSLAHIFSELHFVDKMLKSSPVKGKTYLENFVLKVPNQFH